MASWQWRNLQRVPAWSGVDTELAARGPPGEPLGIEQRIRLTGGLGAFRTLTFAKGGDHVWLRNYSLLC